MDLSAQGSLDTKDVKANVKAALRVGQIRIPAVVGRNLAGKVSLELDTSSRHGLGKLVVKDVSAETELFHQVIKFRLDELRIRINHDHSLSFDL